MASDPRFPDIKQLREFLTPERIALLKKDPARRALINEVTTKLAHDPQFMSFVENMLKAPRSERDPKVEAFAPDTFGWTQPADLPSPRAAVAAIAAAVVPMVAEAAVVVAA